jgi:AmmeMemoRadiSam system protein A
VPAESAGIVNVVRATPVMTAAAAIGAAETLVPTFIPCVTPASSLRKETTIGFPAAAVIVAGEKAKSRARTSASFPADGDEDGEGDAPGRATAFRVAQRENPVERTWVMSVRAAFMRFTAARSTETVRVTPPALVERVAGRTADTLPGLAHVPARIVTVTGALVGSAFSRNPTEPVPVTMATTVTVPLAPPDPTDPRHDRSTAADETGAAAISMTPAARRAEAAAGARPRREAPARGPAPVRWRVASIVLLVVRRRPAWRLWSLDTSRRGHRFSGGRVRRSEPHWSRWPLALTLWRMDQNAQSTDLAPDPGLAEPGPARPGPAVGDPPALTAEERATLLRLARACVEAAAAGRPAPAPDDRDLTDGLLAPRATFVTLRDRHGELRGCIGHLDDERPTWENVRTAARGAAVRDPRFFPVVPGEVPGLVVDVNVLGDAVDLPDPATFDPVRHGVIVSRDGRRALLLPNVGPPLGWDARRTLDALCQKAGLPADAWRRHGTRLQVFATTEFGEEPVV